MEKPKLTKFEESLIKIRENVGAFQDRMASSPITEMALGFNRGLSEAIGGVQDGDEEEVHKTKEDREESQSFW